MNVKKPIFTGLKGIQHNKNYVIINSLSIIVFISRIVN